MKVIYFDSNDFMYSEEEVKTKGMDTKHLTRMVVRIAENERKRLQDAKSKQKKVELEKFLNEINKNKSELLSNSRKGGIARSCRDGNLSASSKGGSGSIKLQPRHFKKKEGAVWLNMFETISRNQCLQDKNRKHQRSLESRTNNRKILGIQEADERLEVSSQQIPVKHLRNAPFK